MARGNIRLTLAAGALAAASLSVFTQGPLGTLATVMGSCPVEDSTWCVWDARVQGNGEGNSFVSFTEDVWMVVGPYYIDGAPMTQEALLARYEETGADLGYETEWTE